ncbi:glycoside hydrolase family 32 protein [Streptomyces sp. 3MP-14]|uniref:beta-fructofuranosidase n=1 Tax=Streptomyces mimosae TaxID=2586635 RepID=A0A5N6AAY3_9ACTN|nr:MULTISPECIES: glycoside hydrolase family 32 protein [Streptomyces]KAB8165801.1 glycoside hydrolase family 32 protein [Streptomyces mimosae]KAB8176190.1 glycoside hydrolase family 32 protein [Streptomyces sp. 3MP-14]
MTRPHDPRHHLRPPAGWANDPNGPFRWRGRHHLFYQHNPDGPWHRNIHWGHASSTDLLEWEHHPVALAPTPGGPDAAGCWSGCVVDDEGVPTAVYTGVDERHTGLGTILLARAAEPDDPLLREWKPSPVPVVAGPPEGLDVVMFRDPFVFRHGGRRWALVGAGHADGTPSVLLYDCQRLTDWRFAGVLLDGRSPGAGSLASSPSPSPSAVPGPATGWECPQLFAAGGGDRWVLVLSLWNGDPQSVVWLSGRLREVAGPTGPGLAFLPEARGPVDQGRDCYAPAVRADADRTLLWGWSWEARGERAVAEAGWAGLLTLPREVGVHGDGTLRVVPAREVVALRAEEPLVVGAGRGPLGPVPLPDAYEVSVTAEHAPVLVELARDARGGALALLLDPGAGTVELRRADWPRERGGRPADAGPLPLSVAPAASLTVRVWRDGSVLELFAGEGRAVATERVYPRPGDRPALRVRAAGPGAAFSATAWALRDASRR